MRCTVYLLYCQPKKLIKNEVSLLCLFRVYKAILITAFPNLNNTFNFFRPAHKRPYILRPYLFSPFHP